MSDRWGRSWRMTDLMYNGRRQAPIMDPCPRCEAAYAEVVKRGHIGSTITCPVCGRHALRP